MGASRVSAEIRFTLPAISEEAYCDPFSLSNCIGNRIDFCDKHGLSKRNAQALALANRVMGDSLMRAQHIARLVDKNFPEAVPCRYSGG